MNLGLLVMLGFAAFALVYGYLVYKGKIKDQLLTMRKIPELCPANYDNGIYGDFGALFLGSKLVGGVGNCPWWLGQGAVYSRAARNLADFCGQGQNGVGVNG